MPWDSDPAFDGEADGVDSDQEADVEEESPGLVRG